MVPTLADVARATGFSASTVSYALANKGNLSAKTRRLIIKAAEKMGYRANLYAASLRSYRKHPSSAGWPLALLTFKLENGAWYPVEPVLVAIRRTASEKGFLLLQQTIRSPKDLWPTLKTLYARGVYGLIIPSFSHIETNSEVDWSRFSVVSCGRWDTSSRFHNVREDPFSSLLAMWNEVSSRGYKRIGVVACRHPNVIVDDLEREGSIAALQARLTSPAEIVPPFLGGHVDVVGFLAWFEKHRPDVVIGFGEHHYQALINRGISVPRDCAFACLQAVSSPTVASMSLTHDTLGSMALRLMDSLIRHHETGIPLRPETLMFRAIFQPGTSLPSRI